MGLPLIVWYNKDYKGVVLMHQKYMVEALTLAQQAYHENEIPIGAIIVYNDQIIGRGYNKRQQDHNPIGHAEIMAIQEASQFLKSWNLSDCTLYVTVEPCPMCAGALLQSQFGTVVFGVSEPNSGSLGSIVDLSDYPYNHKMNVVKGIMETECKDLMTSFFREVRKMKIKVRKVTEENFEDYLNIRKEVFVEEQQVPIELEIDELDDLSVKTVTHIAAFVGDEMIGTSRLIKDGKTLRVGRVAVLKKNRKQGVGEAMLKYAKIQAENNGYERLVLGAQLTAIPFYEKSGYVVDGEIYLDADIEHKDMVLQLK